MFATAHEKREFAKKKYNLQGYIDKGIIKEAIDFEQVEVAVKVGYIYGRERNLERESFSHNKDWRFGEWLERTAQVWKTETEKELKEREENIDKYVQQALEKNRFLREVIKALKREGLEKEIIVRQAFTYQGLGWEHYVIFKLPFPGTYLDYGNEGKRKAIVFLPTKEEDNIAYGILKYPPFNLQGGYWGFTGMDIDGDTLRVCE